MPRTKRSVQRLGVLVTAFVGLATFAFPTGVSAHPDDHQDHAPPGNPITQAVSNNVTLTDSDGGASGGHVVVQGKRLYVGAYGLGMRIFSIADPANPRLIGQYTPGERADAVPDAAVFGGRHIAVLNGTRRVTGPISDIRTDRSEFLDVTNPAQPKLLWTFVGPDDGEAHNGEIIDARRLWLPSGGVGPNGLRIYSLRPLLNATPGAPTNLFRGDPVALWEKSPHRGDKAVGPAFTHTHDITVYRNHPVRQANGTTMRRDIILLAEGGNYLNDAGNTGSVFIIDITNASAPVVLQRWFHSSGPDHHPIRYTHEAQLLAGDKSVMLVTDEDMHHPCGEGGGGAVDDTGGGVVAVRLSPNLRNATELSEWFIPVGTPAPVCSVHVFSSSGRNLYIGSYNAGLQVVSYRYPRNPRQVGYYIAPGTAAWGALYHKGYVYVGDTSRGLDTFRFTP